MRRQQGWRRVDVAGRHRGGLKIVLPRRVVGPGFVGYRLQGAVVIGGEAKALDGVAAMRRGREDLLPGQRQLDRTVQHAGRHRRQDRVRLYLKLRAEPAADIPADKPDFVLWHQ
jgi:hypothetical protein